MGKALSLDPTLDAWLSFGHEGGDWVDGQWISMKECFEKALCLDPKNHRAWEALGHAGGGEINGQMYDKNTCFDRVTSLDPTINSQSYAREDWELSLSMNPKEISFWYHMGQKGGGQVNGEEYSPKGCYKKALSLNPKDVDSWNKLSGEGGGKVGGYKFSPRECMVRVLSLQPDIAVWWFDLFDQGGGEVNGQYYSQKDCYEKYSALSSCSKESKDPQERLCALRLSATSSNLVPQEVFVVALVFFFLGSGVSFTVLRVRSSVSIAQESLLVA